MLTPFFNRMSFVPDEDGGCVNVAHVPVLSLLDYFPGKNGVTLCPPILHVAFVLIT